MRENAEQKVWSRLDYFRSLKRKRSSKQTPLKVGVLGCMAERLKTKLLETDKMVDLVAGPGMYIPNQCRNNNKYVSYQDLPQLLSIKSLNSVENVFP